MYPSASRMPSTAPLTLETGTARSSLNARLALRMRVSRSATGSFTLLENRRCLVTMTPSSPPEARPRAPARGSRYGRAGTACRRRGHARTAGSACRRARGTSDGAAACSSVLSWPCVYLLPCLCDLLKPREREAERGQQASCLVVGGRGRHDRDVHASDLRHLVVVDLREDQLLGHAHRVVAMPVERARSHAPEVADTRKSERYQAVVELPHAVAAQRDLRADRHTFAQLETCDRLAGLGDDGLLTGDDREVVDRGVEHARVLDGVADAHVHHDLVEARHLHHVLEAERRL